MKSNLTNKSCLAFVAGVAALFLSFFGSTALFADDYSFSGDASTIFRMRPTLDNKNIFPAYEYLRLSMTDSRSDGSAVSFYLGAWGRADLADKSTDKYTDSDLQYAYLSYKAAKNNSVFNLGRQFVTEGVAAEKLDGLYIRSDFAAGIGAAAFAGKSVITTPGSKGDNFIYGAHLTQSMPKYYSVGVSALQSFKDDRSRYREELGGDLWVHPMDKVDLTGRSSYNAITDGWMEHTYVLTITPLENLKVSGDYSRIRYRHFFGYDASKNTFNMTTNVFNPTTAPGGIIDPRERVETIGASVAYSPIKSLTVSADFKNYDYNVAGNSRYYGGKATLSLPDSFVTGLGLHRMQGSNYRLCYTESRLFASKQLGKADFAADVQWIHYDYRINGIHNSYTVTGAAGYELSERLKVGADLEYSKNPDFNSEVRGLVKITYAFDTKRSVAGGKHEK